MAGEPHPKYAVVAHMTLRQSNAPHPRVPLSTNGADSGHLAPRRDRSWRRAEPCSRLQRSDCRGRSDARKVRVTLGPPHNRGDAIVVPLSWKSSALPDLFPVLDGELEVAPLDPERCRVTLTASYVPPLGEVGRQLDHALFHRVAHSTVRAFLDRVADSLEENASVRDLRLGWE